MYELVALWLTALAIGAWIYIPRFRTGLLVIAAGAFVGFAASTFALGREVLSDQTAPAAVVVGCGGRRAVCTGAGSTTHFKVTEGLAS